MLSDLSIFLAKSLLVFCAVAPLISGVYSYTDLSSRPSSIEKRYTTVDESSSHIQCLAKSQARQVLDECLARGINIYGEIPHDSQLLPSGHPDNPLRSRSRDGRESNSTFGYSFAEGSDASLWASAQVFMSQYPELVNNTQEFKDNLSKRFLKRIGIGMWRKGNNGWGNPNNRPCQGAGFWVPDVQYEDSHHTDMQLYSVGISYRALSTYNVEWLEIRDFAGWPYTRHWEPCKKYRYTVLQKTAPGCHIGDSLSCFVLHSREITEQWKKLSPPLRPKTPALQFHPAV